VLFALCVIYACYVLCALRISWSYMCVMRVDDDICAIFGMRVGVYYCVCIACAMYGWCVVCMRCMLCACCYCCMLCDICVLCVRCVMSMICVSIGVCIVFCACLLCLNVLCDMCVMYAVRVILHMRVVRFDCAVGCV